MNKEMKICLPFYKMAYSIFFVVILSVIRGVGFTYEIGAVMEAPMALLAMVFCADTYMQEIISGRSEVWRLCPMKKRMASMMSRLIIQEAFLLLLAAAGYGLFLVFQKPLSLYELQQRTESELRQFLVYLAALVVTLGFWGILSHTLSCLFRNIWVGISICLILWIVTGFFTVGNRLFGSWNLFSYTFRNVGNSKDLSWLCGKIVCILSGMIMVIILPKIIKKRG